MRFLLLLPLCLLAACASTAPEAATQETATATMNVAADVPADFALTMGEAGLSAGQMKGHTIAADGSVTAWRGKAVGQNAKEVGQLTPAQRQALWTLVESANALEASEETMEMSHHFLIVEANGKRQRLAWVRTNTDSIGARLMGACQLMLASLA